MYEVFIIRIQLNRHKSATTLHLLYSSLTFHIFIYKLYKALGEMFQNLEKYFWHINLIYFSLSDLVKKFGSSPFSFTDKSHINQVCMHDPSSLSNCNACFGCWIWPTFFASATWLRSFVQVHYRLLTNPTSTKYICMILTYIFRLSNLVKKNFLAHSNKLTKFHINRQSVSNKLL